MTTFTTPNFSKWVTVIQAIQAVTGRLGLPVPNAAITSPDDETAQQLIALLNAVGRKLIKPTRGIRWRALSRTWTLATVPGQTVYQLPDDWDSFIDSTGWNSSSMLPLMGPVSDSTWSYLTAHGVGMTTFSVAYRVRGNQLELFSSYTSPQTILLDYTSRSWVQIAGSTPVAYRDFIAADDDLIVFDGDLVIAALMLAWRKAKGFDTTAAQMDYNDLEEQAMNADSDAPVIGIAKGGSTPLIGIDNLPPTGFGP